MKHDLANRITPQLRWQRKLTAQFKQSRRFQQDQQSRAYIFRNRKPETQLREWRQQQTRSLW